MVLLTSNCNTSWKGVEVWGNSSETQYEINGVRAQGRLETYEGSIIENARVGVQLWGPNKVDDAGGQISSNGTSFINNGKSVIFAPFENYFPFVGSSPVKDYFGNFTDCEFIVDNTFAEVPFQSFIEMQSVRGISIIGSSFTHERELQASSIDDYGVGILSSSSDFDLIAKCNSTFYPCTSYVRSSMNGLGYGVKSVNGVGTRPYKITRTDFNECYVGIYNNNISGVTLLHNSFNLGTVPDQSLSSDQFGIYFEEGINGFTCQENTFIGTSGNVSNSIGIMSENIGHFNNVIRKNAFENLVYSCIAEGNNSTPRQEVNGNIYDRGLLYLCNYNTSTNSIDFSVINDGTSAPDRIRETQGISYFDPSTQRYLYRASGNKFASTSTDFLNNGDIINYYYYYPNDIAQVPQSIIGNIDDIQSSENKCITKYCNPPCNDIIEVANLKTMYHSMRNELRSVRNHIDSVKSAANQQSLNEKYDKATYLKRKMDSISLQLVSYYQNDTIYFNQDSIETWLKNQDVFNGDLALAINYSINNENGKSLQALNRASSRSVLSLEQTVELNDISSFLTIVNDAKIYNLDETALQSLEYIATLNNYIGHRAKNILYSYGYDFSLIYNLPSQSFNRKKNKFNKVDLVTVYPNPSNGLINFYWSNSEKYYSTIRIQILDVNGKVIRDKTLKKKENQSIQLVDVTSGLYFYRIYSKDDVVENGKLIIMEQ